MRFTTGTIIVFNFASNSLALFVNNNSLAVTTNGAVKMVYYQTLKFVTGKNFSGNKTNEFLS